MRKLEKLHLALALFIFLSLLTGLAIEGLPVSGNAKASSRDSQDVAKEVYLPLVLDKYTANTSATPPPSATPTPTLTPVSVQHLRRVNAPYFAGPVIYEQAAIFWFGKVNQTSNYADVRVGYDDSELYVSMDIFDRRLWYNPNPSTGSLTAWDASSLYLDLDGNVGSGPSANAYRFDAQLNWWEPREGYQAAYRGNGAGWLSATIPVSTTAGWRGDAPNDNVDDRGWTVEYDIPFSSLGLSGPPTAGHELGNGRYPPRPG